MQAIINRFKEPSSHAGLAAFSQFLKVVAPTWGAVWDAAAMLFAALAVALPENGYSRHTCKNRT